MCSAIKGSQIQLYNREVFANKLLQMTDENKMHVGNVWFTDKAHFHLKGYVNKQNWQICGTKNPFVSHSKPLCKNYSVGRVLQ